MLELNMKIEVADDCEGEITELLLKTVLEIVRRKDERAHPLRHEVIPLYSSHGKAQTEVRFI